MPRSYALGSDFDALIDGLLKDGRFSDASEVLREGLRLVEEQEKRRASRTAELRRLVEEARSDPRPPVEADEALARLEARYAAADVAGGGRTGQDGA